MPPECGDAPPAATAACAQRVIAIGARIGRLTGRASLQCRRMDMQQLLAFVEVVQHGSFAAAARRLNTAPSAVTRSVAALERELGVRLMQRTTRKLALTDAGGAYYEQVRGLLLELERAGDEARAAMGHIAGTVRVTASVAYGHQRIVPLLRTLHAHHPQLELELLLSDAVVDLVGERIDLAVRLGSAVDPSLIGAPLAPVRYRVCASPAYIKAHGRPRTPADLSACDCVRFPFPNFRAQWRFRDRQGSEQTVDVRGWLVLSNAMAIHRAALDGLGPALLADWLIDDDIAAGRLVDLFPAHQVSAGSFDSAVWLLYPSRTYVPQRVRVVTDFLRQALAKA
jgi:DNA-binding transcriptional LysR family regulator